MFRTAAVLLIVTATSGCRARVQHGLEERDANEIVSALAARGFDAGKVPEKARKPSWAVEVARGQATDAVRVLSELQLPRPARALTRELVTQSALVDSPSAERARQLEGVEGDLEQAFESLDGVASAAVELAVPLAPPRPGQPQPATRASVLLRVRPDAQTRLAEQREALRGLVAGSVEGLRAEEVALFIDVAQVRAPLVVQTIGPPRQLIWGLLSAMLLFAAGFIFLLLRQVFAAAPRQAARAAAPSAAAPARKKSSTPRQPNLPPTFIRAPQRAA